MTNERIMQLADWLKEKQKIEKNVENLKKRLHTKWWIADSTTIIVRVPEKIQDSILQQIIDHEEAIIARIEEEINKA